MMVSGDLSVLENLIFFESFSNKKYLCFRKVIFRYGKQASADELNELYGDSRANGLGHEVQ